MRRPCCASRPQLPWRDLVGLSCRRRATCLHLRRSFVNPFRDARYTVGSLCRETDLGRHHLLMQLLCRFEDLGRPHSTAMETVHSCSRWEGVGSQVRMAISCTPRHHFSWWACRNLGQAHRFFARMHTKLTSKDTPCDLDAILNVLFFACSLASASTGCKGPPCWISA